MGARNYSGDSKRQAALHSKAFPWLNATLFTVIAFVCSGFSSSASWAVFFFLAGTNGIDASHWKLLAKAIFFSTIVLTSIAVLIRLARSKPELPGPGEHVSFKWGRKTIAAISLFTICLAGLCVFRLAHSPHIEPDEAHHLIVARNLAMHGVYGSGMPATGYRAFDDYDSVGPTVIGPAALGIHLVGDPVLGGRLVMAAFYVALSLLVFTFSASARASSGVLASAAMFLAPGSLYLSRTLYGEAPALALLIAGLLLWSRALESPRPIPLCVACGVLFGCAVITKYFLVVAVWPALGTWLYDALTYRRIRWIHAFCPAVVALILLSAWLTVTSIYGPQGEETALGHLAVYQHNLLFGLGSLKNTLGWLGSHWIAVLFCFGLGLLAAYAVIILSFPSPATVFLLLFTILNTYWWIFFTTGTIPRYLWFGLAIGAIFAGQYIGGILNFSIPEVRLSTLRTGTAIVMAVGMLVTALFLVDAVPRVYAMLSRDEMHDEYALIEHIQSQYAGRKVATTFYPVERTANLLAEFPLARVKPTDRWTPFDAVIVDTISQPEAAQRHPGAQTFGRYAIIDPGEDR